LIDRNSVLKKKICLDTWLMREGGSRFIFSVDTERDIRSLKTKVEGWKRISLLFDLFDSVGMRGKVNWLVEYDLRDGFLSANPQSEFFVRNHLELFEEMKKRGDEIGLHPSMYDFNARTDTWDKGASGNPVFVRKVLDFGTREFRRIFRQEPVGCRVGAFHPCTGLEEALERNGIWVDSSTLRRTRERIRSPNAHFLGNTRVLEIPTTGYVHNGSFDLVFYKAKKYLNRPVFLSYYIHNWQVVRPRGEPDTRFLHNLKRFLEVLASRSQALSFREAYQAFTGPTAERS